MLLFGRRPPLDDPSTDPHRRRRASRRARRNSWLRLAFWLRGNRKVRQKTQAPLGDSVVIASGGAVVEAASTAQATTPQGAPPPKKGARRWDFVHLLLRLTTVVCIAAVLFGGCYGLLRFLLHSQKFAIREVCLKPTVHVSRERLLARAHIELGQNLFRLDLAQIERNLKGEPWLKSVRVRRELPATVAIDVTEYEPAILLALGPLYLADGEGVVFKRATPQETVGMPVMTGLGREAYLSDRAESQDLVKEAIAAAAAYRSESGSSRPPIGEVHVERFAGITLYTGQGVAIRLGRGEPEDVMLRLRRFDAVWAALQKQEKRPQVVFLDNRAHPDHVTVHLEK